MFPGENNQVNASENLNPKITLRPTATVCRVKVVAGQLGQRMGHAARLCYHKHQLHCQTPD